MLLLCYADAGFHFDVTYFPQEFNTTFSWKKLGTVNKIESPVINSKHAYV